jgi:hypothetical protein
VANLATHQPTLTGLRFDNLLAPANAGGDSCLTGSGVYLVVKNAHTSPQNIVILTPQVLDGDLTVSDRTVAVPNGAEMMIPITDRYRDPSTGRASITYPGGVTGLSVCVVRS